MQGGANIETAVVRGGPPASESSAPSAAPEGPNTIGRALVVLGDSWTLLILQRAFLGVRRFGGWRSELGISESVLAGRLRDMTDAGLFETRPYRDGGRTRQEYRLTARGLDLWALLVSIWSWERAWVPRAVPLPDLVHVGCGCRTDVELVCGGCGEAVTARDTVTTRRPGASFAGAVPPRLHPRRTRGSLPADPLSAFPGTAELLGDRWSTAVLAGAMLGLRSFMTFQRELQVSPDVLADRLRRFVALGVLVPGEGGYRLTAKGRATFPMLAVLMTWADRWLAEGPVRPALRMVHRGCDAVLDPRLVCAACAAPLERRDVRFALVSAQ